MSKRYRLYIDESGDHTMNRVDDPGKRFLGLTGVIVESEQYRTAFQPALEVLKQTHFPHNPDEPVILHREDIINKRGPFGVLKDEERRQSFDADLLQFFGEQEYTIITVVIDKQSHAQRYGQAAQHPYHYCLAAMLERYAGFLRAKGGHGDVMAESRGGREDQQLKTAYTSVYDTGTYYRQQSFYQQVITSREIKIKKKEANIAGLQAADTLAHPCKQEMLKEKTLISSSTDVFGQSLCACVSSKYNRWAMANKVHGYGKVWFKETFGRIFSAFQAVTAR